MEQYLNKVICADSLVEMQNIAGKSVDMILCDLPYGTTTCKWDTIIPFEPLWEQYKRIIKDNGAIVLTASQPFTSALVMSNIKMFKYEWVWDKDKGFGVFTAKKRPLKKHENILVFYKSPPTYNYQMKDADPKRIRPLSMGNKNGSRNNITNSNNCRTDKNYDPRKRYPDTILTYSNPVSRSIHPTQKPVALFEYLIKTYTSVGDIVLDNCAGSFTTAIASENLKRNWICIEKEAEYCEIGRKRIEENRQRLSQDLLF